MNQIKIGEFISKKRKENNITQSELAEKLNITDRAISKWENGVCLPDACNMLDLCSILGITVNDLFNGSVVDFKEREKRLEETLIDMVKLKEERDRELLLMEIFIGLIVSIFMLFCVFIASFISMESWLRLLLIIFGVSVFVVGISLTIRIEQVAGYYECTNCHYKYVPTYKSVLFAMHINRTRRMKCPKCHQKIWQRKTLTK